MKTPYMTSDETFHYKGESYPIMDTRDYDKEKMRKIHNFHHHFSVTITHKEYLLLKNKIQRYMDCSDDDAGIQAVRMMVSPSLLKKALMIEHKQYKYLFRNVKFHTILREKTIEVSVQGDRCILLDMVPFGGFVKNLTNFIQDGNFRHVLVKEAQYLTQPNHYPLEKIHVMKVDDEVQALMEKSLFPYKYRYLLRSFYRTCSHPFLDSIMHGENHIYHSLLKDLIINVETLEQLQKRMDGTESSKKEGIGKQFIHKMKAIFKKPKEEGETYLDGLHHVIYEWREGIRHLQSTDLEEKVGNIQQELLLLLKERADVPTIYYAEKVDYALKGLRDSFPKETLSLQQEQLFLQAVEVIEKNTCLFASFMRELWQTEEKKSATQTNAATHTAKVENIKNNFLSS